MMRALVVLALLAPLPLAASSGCGAEPDETGSIQLALRDGPGDWFRLRVFNGDPGESLDGTVVFNTDCIEARSRTYELTNIPAGSGKTVVVESFATADCAADRRVEMGFRGDVTIPSSGAAPYFHVPLYDVEGVSPLPENLNISASLAESIDFCDSDEACSGFGAGFVCYDAQKPDYWCVPGCTTNEDCSGFHPRSTCDQATSWCMLRSPFPLNLSEPRAFGHAATLSNGGVAFMGGFGRTREDWLIPGNWPVETFNPTTGLFERPPITGLSDWKGSGLAGMAALGSDRFALVGGSRNARFRWRTDPRRAEFDDRGTECVLDGCDEGISSDVVIIAVSSGKAGITQLDVPVSQPAVVALNENSFLVAGGYTLDGDTVVRGDRVWVCTDGGDLLAQCQDIGTLDIQRGATVAACIDEGCQSVIVAGGAKAGPFAERIDLNEGDPQFSVFGGPGGIPTVFQPQLCGLTLVAGAADPTSPGGFQPGTILVDDALSFDVLDGDRNATIFPGVAPVGGDAGCWVIGGIDPQGRVSSEIWLAKSDSVSPTTYDTRVPRFGAAAAAITSGPLSGGVMLGGGLGLQGEGNGRSIFVLGAEVLWP